MNPKTSQSKIVSPLVKVSRRGVNRLKDGHVWVYRSDIVSADGVPSGSLVTVADDRGKPLGTALYSSSSQIAVRMISQEPSLTSPSFSANASIRPFSTVKKLFATPTPTVSSLARATSFPD